MKKILISMLMLLASFSADAQFQQGQVLTSSALNAALAAPNITGGTITGLSAPIPIGSGGTGANTATGATNQLRYAQGATGSVARSLTSKLQDAVSVLDFAGVDATGTNDSTAGEQAAINAVCAAGGGTVYFPAGTYKTSTLSLTCNGIQIQGAGVGATTINATTTTGNVFGFSGTTTQGIRDLLINYTVAPTGGAAISVANVRNFTADRIKIAGAYQGININGGVIQYFTNLEIINTVATNGVGIYFTGFGNDQFLKNVVMDNPAGAQPLAGIRVNNTNAIWMDAIDVIHSGTGLLIDPQGASDFISWLFVSNSAFDTGSGDGISISPANAAAVVKGVTFSGSWTATNSLMGVRISGAGIVDGVRFVGHRSFNNTQSGFYVNGGATGTRKNLAFNDCDASGNSSSAAGTYSGFDIGAGISGFSITNSRSGQQAQFNNTQAQGVLVNAGASNNYIIDGNDLRGNVSNSLLDNGTGTTKIVSNNIGDVELGSTVAGLNVVSARGSGGDVLITDTGTNGVNLKMVGNGATTPSKTMRVIGGNLQFLNDAYSAVIASLTDSGSFSANAINSTPIGGTTPAAGSFTTLNANGSVTLVTSGATTTVNVQDTGANGANLKLTGNGAATPSKAIRANSGNLQFLNDAYSAVIASLTDTGSFSANAINATPIGGTTPAAGSFTTLAATSGLRVAEGANAKQLLSAAMTAGSVTVANTSVTANSRIICTRQPGGTNPGAAMVTTITAGTSFVVTSTNAADTGPVACQIFEPA